MQDSTRRCSRSRRLRRTRRGAEVQRERLPVGEHALEVEKETHTPSDLRDAQQPRRRERGLSPRPSELSVTESHRFTDIGRGCPNFRESRTRCGRIPHARHYRGALLLRWSSSLVRRGRPSRLFPGVAPVVVDAHGASPSAACGATAYSSTKRVHLPLLAKLYRRPGAVQRLHTFFGPGLRQLIASLRWPSQRPRPPLP